MELRGGGMEYPVADCQTLGQARMKVAIVREVMKRIVGRTVGKRAGGLEVQARRRLLRVLCLCVWNGKGEERRERE